MVEKVNTYEVVVERDDNDSWFAWLADDRRCHTWGRTLSSVGERMDEAVALWFEVEPDAFELRFDIRLSGDARRLVESARKARMAAEKASAKALAATSRAAVGLATEAGLSLRDAGELLGLSHQRVQQLIGETRAAAHSYQLPARPASAIAEKRASYRTRGRQR
jgi:predicted RNase H-like HicB family nuclease